MQLEDKTQILDLNWSNCHFNLSSAELVEQAIIRQEGQLSQDGAFCVLTGKFTGRSPKDKFFVIEPSSSHNIWWDGGIQGISESSFNRLWQKAQSHIKGRDLFIQDLQVNSDPLFRQNIRVITELAWQSLFAKNLFIRPSDSELCDFQPAWTVVSLPSLIADPKTDGTNSQTFIVIHLAAKIVLIGGTGYAGEIKKSVFSVLNYELPLLSVLPMHCSANVAENGDVALFFGLSGTGKTTLSTDSMRKLIGDDEHGWSDHGIFNFEGGCYAKTIRISAEKEPEIYSASRRFGTILENVEVDPKTRSVNFDSERFTENTRAAYPIHFIPNIEESQLGGHPKHILFLSADAFGVLPPVAKLNEDQIEKYFLAGYTAKVAGTERGVTEPEPVFSTCFAAPFIVHRPKVYSSMLVQKVRRYGASVWLINTGWSGGPYGIGKRFDLLHTRTIVRAITSGQLDSIPTTKDEIFGLSIPQYVPGVPTEILNPRQTWENKDEYDRQAHKLKTLFDNALQKLY